MGRVRTLTGLLCLISGIILAGNAAADTDKVSPKLVMHRGEEEISLPLLKTDVQADVTGFAANVTVTQSFVNPYDGFIEATYVFPLPENAAVNAMVMHLPGRDVVAEIKVKEEAERIYEEATAAGKTAALLNQERANIFTQKVGNIPPGEKVDVSISYVDILPYEAGVSSFVFPMVVGPRYIPGEPLESSQDPSGRIPDTTRVADASRITPPSFDEGETGAHRIDLTLNLRPGKPIRSVSSSSHQLDTRRISANQMLVRLAETDKVPDKDFILKIDLRGEMPDVAAVPHKDSGEAGYVTVAIQPPSLPKRQDIAPKDLFFVVDNSGSMHGAPLDAAKALIKEALNHMNPNDRFTIMRFSDDVSTLSSTPLDNTPDNVSRGLKFISAMNGMGGTEMLSGVKRALEGTVPDGRVRIVFFLTDGYIGNDDEILAAVKNQNTAEARLFSLGVGSSVNRYLLSSMARLGRGEMQVMRYDEDPIPFVEKFYKRIQNPVLTDVTLSFKGLSITDQTPNPIGDLFDGQPLLIHARYKRAGKGEMILKGKIGKRRFKKSYPLFLPDTADRPEIASLWARAMISMWNDEETDSPGSKKEEITDLALKHNLMSKYTSFVAVDKEVARPADEPLIPVAQRIPLPDGVSRRALGDLSRREIPPGDPFIQVAVPADAQSVTAFFPFGLVKTLTYDEGRGLWRGRFLVPASIPDGYYKIIVAIETKDDEVLYRQEVYHLDSKAEEFICNFEKVRVKAGRGFTLKVDTIEQSAEVYAHSEALDILRVALEPEDGDKRVDWAKWFSVPEDMEEGTYELLVVMRDTAGNRLERTLEVEVY